jgi:ribosomal protein S18 acetylase RimI-like enzyme
MRIEKAELSDLQEILALQYMAYQSQAKLLGDYTIQPLTQTLPEVEREFTAGVILKAVDAAGRIYGSIRCSVKDGTCFIGKVIVHPAQEGKGIGTRLLHEMEKACPCARYELFTSVKSLRNIGFYEKNGYSQYAEKEYSRGIAMVYMEKLT